MVLYSGDIDVNRWNLKKQSVIRRKYLVEAYFKSWFQFKIYFQSFVNSLAKILHIYDHILQLSILEFRVQTFLNSSVAIGLSSTKGKILFMATPGSQLFNFRYSIGRFWNDFFL